MPGYSTCTDDFTAVWFDQCIIHCYIPSTFVDVWPQQFNKWICNQIYFSIFHREYSCCLQFCTVVSKARSWLKGDKKLFIPAYCHLFICPLEPHAMNDVIGYKDIETTNRTWLWLYCSSNWRISCNSQYEVACMSAKIQIWSNVHQKVPYTLFATVWDFPVAETRKMHCWGWHPKCDM